MWRSRVIGICLIVLGTQWASAQDTPRVKVFVGYSRLGVDRSVSSFNRFNGWNAGVTTNLKRHWGVDVDLSANYVVAPHYPEYVLHRRAIYTFLAGPSLFTTVPKFPWGTVFSHIKAGIRRQWDSGNVLCLSAGGGFDLKVSDGFALRLIQADYLPVFFPEHVESESYRSRVANQFRLSAGLVFEIGKL